MSLKPDAAPDSEVREIENLSRQLGVFVKEAKEAIKDCDAVWKGLQSGEGSTPAMISCLRGVSHRLSKALSDKGLEL